MWRALQPRLPHHENPARATFANVPTALSLAVDLMMWLGWFLLGLDPVWLAVMVGLWAGMSSH